MPDEADSPPDEPKEGLTPEEKTKAQSLIDAMEARMRQAETFAWAVPGLALTSQALLLNVAFSPDTTDCGRAAAAFSATAILLAALHFLGKHSFNFDLYEAVIEREREKLTLDRVSKRWLLNDLDSFPKDTNLIKRKWKPRKRDRPVNWHSWPSWFWVIARNRFIVKVKAVTVWAWVLGILAAIDVVVLADALRDWRS